MLIKKNVNNLCLCMERPLLFFRITKFTVKICSKLVGGIHLVHDYGKSCSDHVLSDKYAP